MCVSNHRLFKSTFLFNMTPTTPHQASSPLASHACTCVSSMYMHVSAMSPLVPCVFVPGACVTSCVSTMLSNILVGIPYPNPLSSYVLRASPHLIIYRLAFADRSSCVLMSSLLSCLGITCTLVPPASSVSPSPPTPCVSLPSMKD